MTLTSFVFALFCIIALIIYFIGIVISQFISYKILKSKTNYKKLNYLSILVYIVIMFIFAYLTHNPIHNDIFFNFEKKKYRI